MRLTILVLPQVQSAYGESTRTRIPARATGMNIQCFQLEIDCIAVAPNRFISNAFIDDAVCIEIEIKSINFYAARKSKMQNEFSHIAN
jgi:hypothetical protein